MVYKLGVDEYNSGGSNVSLKGCGVSGLLYVVVNDSS